jgi:hypothetical protein
LSNPAERAVHTNWPVGIFPSAFRQGPQLQLQTNNDTTALLRPICSYYHAAQNTSAGTQICCIHCVKNLQVEETKLLQVEEGKNQETCQKNISSQREKEQRS